MKKQRIVGEWEGKPIYLNEKDDLLCPKGMLEDLKKHMSYDESLMTTMKAMIDIGFYTGLMDSIAKDLENTIKRNKRIGNCVLVDIDHIKSIIIKLKDEETNGGKNE